MEASEFKVGKSYWFRMQPDCGLIPSDLTTQEFSASVVAIKDEETMIVNVDGFQRHFAVDPKDVRVVYPDEYSFGDMGHHDSDKSFLLWVHNRMAEIHDENVNVDYMWKLRSIIRATPKEQLTPNCG